jgi:two-component system chemotaxis response regulator CheY
MKIMFKFPFIKLNRIQKLTPVSAATELEPLLLEFSPPTDELISRLGFAPELLRKKSIIPSQNGEKTLLIVADLKQIARDEFERVGVQIRISSHQRIEQGWLEYEKNRESPVAPTIEIPFEEKVINILQSLCRECAKLGATEVFIGFPERNKYEFVCSEGKFQGKIQQSLFDDTIKFLASNSAREISPPTLPGMSSITVGLTRSFSDVVICLSWSLADQSEKIKDEPSKGILFIDDDERFLFVLTKVFESKGFTEIISISDSELALAKLKSREISPALIISDLHMPDLDGEQFLTEYRRLNKTTPVVILTSDTDPDAEARLALLGASAVIKKQEDPRILFAWCHSLIRASNKSQLSEKGQVVSLNDKRRSYA